jgi:phosphatidylinositol glycan class Z
MQSNSSRAALLGLFVAVGVFARVTFAIFALPFALSFLLADTPLLRIFLNRSISLGLTFVAVCGANAALDSWYFGRPVLTPFNFIQYNSDLTNLSSHGIHPRWLHVAVNLPLLFGPLVLVVLHLVSQAVRGTTANPLRDKLAKGYQATLKDLEAMVRSRELTRACLISALCGLAALSLVPHQEPRFLLPLLPLAIIGIPRLPRSRLFFHAWIVFNAVLTLVYGVIHQGGVVPTAMWIEGHLKDQHLALEGPTVVNADILYWRTYSVPRVLFGVERTSRSPSSSSAVYTERPSQTTTSRLRTSVRRWSATPPRSSTSSTLSLSRTSCPSRRVTLRVAPSWSCPSPAWTRRSKRSLRR